MTELEKILNSGELYQVAEVTSKDIHYHEYLSKMEAFHSFMVWLPFYHPVAAVDLFQ